MDSDVTVRCASFLPPSALDAWLAVDAESRQKVASWMIHSEFIALGNRAEDLSTLRTGFIARVIPSLAGDADDMYKGVELPPWTLDHLAVRMCEWEEYCTPIDMHRWAELFARGFGCSWRVTLWSRRYGPVAYWISKCVAQCCQRRGPPAEEEGSIQVSNVGQAVTASLGGNPWIDDSMPIPDLVVSHDFHETIVHRCATLAEAGSIILERALVATEVGDPQHCLNAPNDATMLDDMLLSFDSRPRCSRNHLVEYFDIEGRTTMIKSANLRGMTVKKVADAKVNYSIDVLRMRDWEIGFTDEPLLGHFIRMLADRYRLSKLDLRMSRGSGNMGMFRNMPSLAHVRTPFIAQELSDEAFSLFADLVSVNFSYSIELTEIRGFRQNPKLRTIRFPGALRRIASHAFSDCASLRRVDLSACPFLEYVDGFNFCSSLIQITLPPSMIEIGANGFAACSSLSTLDLTMCPRLRRIDGFGDCSRLVSLQLPPSVAFIGPTAFHRCVALTRVDLTKCSPDLEVQGFAECDGLARLSVLPRTNLAQAGVSGRYDNVFIERLPETKAASPQPHPPARTLLAVVP